MDEGKRDEFLMNQKSLLLIKSLIFFLKRIIKSFY